MCMYVCIWLKAHINRVSVWQLCVVGGGETYEIWLRQFHKKIGRQKDGKFTFATTKNVAFGVYGLNESIHPKGSILSDEDGILVDDRISMFCRVLVCVVYWPYVAAWGVLTCPRLCIAVCGCLWMCVVVSVSLLLLPSKAWINRSPDQVTSLNERLFLHEKSFQTNSLGVQLYERSWKQQNVTILPNEIPGTTNLISYWFVVKFVFL